CGRQADQGGAGAARGRQGFAPGRRGPAVERGCPDPDPAGGWVWRAGGAGGRKPDTRNPDSVPTKPVQALPKPKNGGSGFVPAPSPTGNAASSGKVAVIRGWADALRRGDVHAAGGYFALPSEMIPGPDAKGEAIVLTLRTRPQADAAPRALPG